MNVLYWKENISNFPSGILCRPSCLWCVVVYSDYSYLCSSDLQTLQAYRSCNVDHGCLCSHLNPPSRFPNTSRARLDTYIRNFLLFALQIYLMIDTIYRNLHYFHQAFSVLFYIQIPEGNHAGRFNRAWAMAWKKFTIRTIEKKLC